MVVFFFFLEVHIEREKDSYELPESYNYLFIEPFLKKQEKKRQEKLAKLKIKNNNDFIDINSFKESITQHKTELLIPLYKKLTYRKLSYKNRVLLFSFKKEIVKKRIIEFTKYRKEYAKGLHEYFKKKYCYIKSIGFYNKTIELDWYYFASKEKRHSYFHAIKKDLLRLHFTKIKFKNSINHKTVIYKINSIKDGSF